MSSNYFTSTMKITGEKRTNKKGKRIIPLSEIKRMQNLAFNENNPNKMNTLQISGKAIVNPQYNKQQLKGIIWYRGNG